MSDQVDCGSVLQFSVLPLTSIVFSQLILPVSVFFFFFSIKSMADPQLSSYIPATISKLAYTPNRHLDNPVSAQALLRAGKHCDGQHADTDNGGLHPTYTELYRSTSSWTPGQLGSHAETAWRTSDDVLDAVTLLLLLS